MPPHRLLARIGLFWLLLLALLRPGVGWAGIVKGRVLDDKQQPLAFANVAVRSTTTSTATNEQGSYELRLAPGTYELVFQYVGFKPHPETVRVAGGDTATVLNISLEAESYRLGEVVVRSTDRDPAYAIIQQAQQWRRYHQREIASFKTRTYIKVLGRFTDVPGKVMGLFKVGPDVKPGIFYLSESVSEVSFQQPNVVREKMISSRVSGDTKGISFNRAGAGRNLSFYNNMLKMGTERGFVSPIAANAMLFYRYALEGTTQQGNITLHKIRVTPRHRTDPAFSGHIYIVDGTWRIHSVSLTLNQDSQLDYVDDMRVEQLFAPVPGHPDVWVLQSQKMVMGFTAFGFKGNGYINAVFSNYTQIVPTFPARPAPKAAPAPPAQPNDEPAPVGQPTAAAIRRQKPQLNNLKQQAKQRVKALVRADTTAAGEPVERLAKGEVLRVEKGVNERDSAYWASVRPVPLTEEEHKDYHQKDSSEAIRNSRPYQDSLDRVRNQPEVMGLLMTGYTYSNSFKKRTFFVEPVYNILLYSTVEGTIVNAKATYTQRTDDRRFLNVTPTLRYGFANQLWSPSVAAEWQYDPVKLARISVAGGRTIENFDPNSQLRPLVNSYYTLFTNRNYAKFYQRDGAEIGYQTEVLNGLTMSGTIGYHDRHELFNNTTKVVRDLSYRAFTSNLPRNEELPNPSFGRSQALTTELTASFRPGQRYITRPDGKFNLGSKAPLFRFSYRQGIAALGSDVRYSLLEFGVRQSINMGLVGTSSYNVWAGGFVGKSRLEFMDYRHFSGSLTTPTANFAQFQLLDYYRFSTSHGYLEAHYNHHFNGFFFNKVPLLRRLKWQEVASLNYLSTKQAGHYVELGVGVEHVFKLLRVDFYTALQSGQKLGTGLRFGIGF